MTNMTDKTKSLLAKAGITIGKGNKLELDEEELKEADISVLKSIFTGSYSFGDQIGGKAVSISNASARAKAVNTSKNATYTRSGTYTGGYSRTERNRKEEKDSERKTESSSSQKD
ncbi:hypothetical protein D3Z36_04390 [Lachnospiraceae bacterium]|nr:hypothetical protein [Lachnospiraceae bacterium]